MSHIAISILALLVSVLLMCGLEASSEVLERNEMMAEQRAESARMSKQQAHESRGEIGADSIVPMADKDRVVPMADIDDLHESPCPPCDRRRRRLRRSLNWCSCFSNVGAHMTNALLDEGHKERMNTIQRIYERDSEGGRVLTPPPSLLDFGGRVRHLGERTHQ